MMTAKQIKALEKWDKDMDNPETKPTVAGAAPWFGEMTAEDIAYHNKWKPASGHPGGWRVVRGICPLQELNGPSGRLLLFRSMESAQRRSDAMNLSPNNDYPTSG